MTQFARGAGKTQQNLGCVWWGGAPPAPPWRRRKGAEQRTRRGGGREDPPPPSCSCRNGGEYRVFHKKVLFISNAESTIIILSGSRPAPPEELKGWRGDTCQPPETASVHNGKKFIDFYKLFKISLSIYYLGPTKICYVNPILFCSYIYRFTFYSNVLVLRTMIVLVWC